MLPPQYPEIKLGGRMQRQEVKVGGLPVGYVEHRRLGDLWAAVAYGKDHYPPPMFSARGYALEFVRQFGRTI